ncbi:hypothetical protein OAH87_05055 [Marinomonas sp.]|nr:hypothetical protein [Marinomonas sp.]MDB4837819.1 hypothetical protein [Marinomonas sp.]
MKIKILAFIVILSISGCSQSNKKFNVRTADFSSASDQDLCMTYGHRANRSTEAKLELISRDIFSQREWKLIDERKLESGMSECAVYSAYYINYKKIRFSKNKNKELIHKELIYSCEDKKVPYCPYTSVIIKDGKIDSIDVKREI